MVKSGSFKVSQGSTAGRVGAGLGKGLGEALPKEVAQQRLASGLKNFAQNASGMNPLDAAAQLFSIPGVTPQMVQILPQLLQQQQLGQALGSQDQTTQQPAQFPEIPQEQPTAGLTTRPGIEASRKSYVRPTLQQIDQRAKELYTSNPKRFGNDPQQAINFAKEEAAQNQGINQDYQTQRANQLALQSGIEQRIASQEKLLGAKVPGDVSNEIIQNALRSILPKEEGGEGLTDQEAIQKAGKEYDDISRQYNAVNAIGSPIWAWESPSAVLNSIKSAREPFKKRGDLRNFADTLTAENGISPGKAYYLAFPPSDIPELKQTLDKIPDLNEILYESGYAAKKRELYNPDAILNQIMPKLAEYMGKQGSPLSIGQVLNSKGYDSSLWYNYLNENRKKLDLTGRQSDELSKPKSNIPNLNDIYLFTLSNQGKLVD